MTTKRLIAAITEVRSRLALVEDLLERGEDEKALDVVSDVEVAWQRAMKELKAA